MADCHDLFQKFNDNIKLMPSKSDFLKKGGNAIRDRIRNDFKSMGKSVPKFRTQGSYAMSTIVNPIDGEYDIDDGVYLQDLDPNKSEWPTPDTVHKWIYDAVKKHTKEEPIDKRTCIRVCYSGQYHIDLPIYAIYNSFPYLAEKGERGWHVSDPRALTNWFKDQVKNEGEQLRRLVRYLKAWADNQSRLGKLPSGLILTILVVNNYEKSDRDDGSFAGTVANIYNQMLGSEAVFNPVDPYERLSDRLTETQINNFRERLSILLDDARDALKENSKQKAAKKWRKEFGDRFPEYKDPDKSKKVLKTSAPAILHDDARFAEINTE